MVRVDDECVRARRRVNVIEAAADRGGNEPVRARIRSRGVVEPRHDAVEEVVRRIRHVAEDPGTGDQVNRRRRRQAHVDRLIRLEVRCGGPDEEYGRPQGEIREACGIRGVRRDELGPPGRVRRVVGRHRRPGNGRAGVHHRDGEDLGWAPVLVHAQADRDGAAAVEAGRRRTRRRVISGGRDGDRVTARRRREGVDAAWTSRRCEGRIDAIGVDERHGGPHDVRRRGDTGADHAVDLICAPDDQRQEGRHPQREHEEHGERADCPVSSGIHSGFSYFALSSVRPPVTQPIWEAGECGELSDAI